MGRGPMGGPPPGAGMSATTARLFGENAAFTADLEMEARGGDAGDGVSMPGKVAFDHGKFRSEMDLSNMKRGQAPPQGMEQMKAMGMDKMVMISRPDKKLSYMIYPGLQGYVENPLPEGEAEAASASDLKMETTELGKEDVDGHPCVKTKAVVTDKEGKTHEALVWNATDLNRFPLRMEMTESGTTVTMNYRNVKLDKPGAEAFEPPAGCAKYENMQQMMQQVMMKRFGGGAVPGSIPRQRPADR